MISLLEINLPLSPVIPRCVQFTTSRKFYNCTLLMVFLSSKVTHEKTVSLHRIQIFLLSSSESVVITKNVLQSMHTVVTANKLYLLLP